MAISHAQPAEVIDITPLGAKLSSSQTTTLIKTARLEVIRLVLPAGKVLPPHRVAGEITVQCLEGSVIFTTRGTDHQLSVGSMLYLAGSDEHAVRANTDASLLVTILLAQAKQ